jgi:hypothetical protein
VTAPSSRGEDAPRPSIDPLRLLTAVGSPIALATTLALYFGWVRSSAQSAEFGADVSVFDMSPQDLVLRSIDVLFFPILLVLLLGLGLVRLEPWLREHAGPASRILRFSWVLAPVAGVLVVVTDGAASNLLPLFVLVAIGGTAYGNVLHRYANGDTSPPRLVNVALVGALLIAALFWQTERLARVGGKALADDLRHNLAARLPTVTLLSEKRLQIDGTCVTEMKLDAGTDSAYTYRYEGLYLLQRSRERNVIITDGWVQHAGRLLVFADSDTIRMEFGKRPRECGP